eukprot:gene8203-biopygen22607
MIPTGSPDKEEEEEARRRAHPGRNDGFARGRALPSRFSQRPAGLSPAAVTRCPACWRPRAAAWRRGRRPQAAARWGRRRACGAGWPHAPPARSEGGGDPAPVAFGRNAQSATALGGGGVAADPRAAGETLPNIARALFVLSRSRRIDGRFDPSASLHGEGGVPTAACGTHPRPNGTRQHAPVAVSSRRRSSSSARRASLRALSASLRRAHPGRND